MKDDNYFYIKLTMDVYGVGGKLNRLYKQQTILFWLIVIKEILLPSIILTAQLIHSDILIWLSCAFDVILLITVLYKSYKIKNMEKRIYNILIYQ